MKGSVIIQYVLVLRKLCHDLGIMDGLMRLSVEMEHLGDLKKNIEQDFTCALHARLQ